MDEKKLVQMAEDIAVTKTGMETLTAEMHSLRKDVQNLSVVSRTEFKEHVTESKKRMDSMDSRIDIVEEYIAIQKVSWWIGFKKNLSNHISKILISLVILLLLAIIGMYGDIVKLTIQSVKP